MPEIYIKVHYCIVCKKAEVCQEETCDFRELMHSHGACYGKLSKKQQVELDQVIEKGLPADVKEADRKAKRSCYMKEYRKQWKELNPKYHNVYRENNPDTMKTIRKRYTSSDKGKAVRKKYADKTKTQRSEYQKNYMKEYRAKKKAEKLSQKRYTTRRPFAPNLGVLNRKSANPLTSPNRQMNPQFNPPTFGKKQKQKRNPDPPIDDTARAILRAKQVREMAEIKKAQMEVYQRQQKDTKSRLSSLTKQEKATLLKTRIRELETLLELGTEGTQGVVSLQKQLMKCKTALRRL